MRDLDFPIQFKFKISSLANDFQATDRNGNYIAYVRQKLFKLKESIVVYSDEQKRDVLYTIDADRWIDFSAAYAIKRTDGSPLGKIARKGWASLWKAKYEVIDQRDELQFHIREENAWIKMFDSLLGEIPILGLLTGYFFNPAYIVTDLNDKLVARIQKDPSFWGRNFTVTKESTFDSDDGERIVLCLMMMILLERRKG